MAASSQSDQLDELTKNFKSLKEFDRLMKQIKKRKNLFGNDELKQKILNLKLGEGDKKRIVSLDKIDLNSSTHIEREIITIYAELHSYQTNDPILSFYFDRIHDPNEDHMYWRVNNDIYNYWFKYLDFSGVIERFQDYYFEDYENLDWKKCGYGSRHGIGYETLVSVEVYVYSPLIQIHEFDITKIYLCYDYKNEGLNWFQIDIGDRYDHEIQQQYYHALKINDDGSFVEEKMEHNRIIYYETKNGLKIFAELDVFDVKDNPQFLKNEELEPSAKIARKK